MDKLMQRYNQNEQEIIKVFFEKCAKATRKSGKMSDSVKKKQLVSWQKFDKKAVTEGLNIYNSMKLKKDMGERYAWGIIKNKDKVLKTKELMENGSTERNTVEAEGERVARLAEQYAGKDAGDIKCDF